MLFGGYESDIPDDKPLDVFECEIEGNTDEDNEAGQEEPPMKRQWRILEIPAWEARRQKKLSCCKDLERALKSIDGRITSQKTKWDGGEHGLEATRAQAIRSYLQLVLKGSKGIEASEIAAQSHNFSKVYGGRAVRQWANEWIKNEDLPTSQRRCHVKLSSVLDDPEIAAEVCSYLRSNKWATNPRKFQEFVNKKMLPEEVEKYAKHIVNKEMPQGMKRYLKLELFP